jgi:hypothetical protein
LDRRDRIERANTGTDMMHAQSRWVWDGCRWICVQPCPPGGNTPGPQGPRGPQGPEGPPGPQGEPGGSSVLYAFVGPTPPLDPQLGQLWWNTSGHLYVWDGTTWQLVAPEMSENGTPTPPPTPEPQPPDFGGSFGTVTDGSPATINIGTPSPTRMVVVGFGQSGYWGSLPSSVTIGGVPATLLTSATASVGTAFFAANVPTGTTTTLEVTGSGSYGVLYCAYSVDTAGEPLVGYSSGPNDTVASVTFTVGDSGYVIALAENMGPANNQGWSANVTPDGTTSGPQQGISFARGSGLSGTQTVSKNTSSLQLGLITQVSVVTY